MTQIISGSGNTPWFEKKYNTGTYALRILDRSSSDDIKKVIVFLKNQSEDDTPSIWQYFIIPNKAFYGYFNFSGTNYISVRWDEVQLELVSATNGRAYSVTSDGIVDVGSSGVGGAFTVSNSNDFDIDVAILRNDSELISVTITPDGTHEFQFRPTFWIYATTDLEAEIDFEDVNTEISVLGVSGADLVIGGSGPFSFTLQNIT